MSEHNDSNRKGMPIYGDSQGRSVSDPIAAEVDVTDWHPANSAAGKLWRCLEALRDIDNLLGGCEEMWSVTEQRRRIKVLATPLYSLVGAIRDLANVVEQNPDSRSRLSDDQVASLRVLRDSLAKGIPTDEECALRALRDKISAHVDKKITPDAARRLIDATQVDEVGRWLHRAVEAVVHLLNLDVYAWTTSDCPAGYFKLMACEPFLLTFRMEGDRPVDLVAVQVSQSPRAEIQERLSDVVEKSQWMFSSEEPRIRSLAMNESPPDKWPDDGLHI